MGTRGRDEKKRVKPTAAVDSASVARIINPACIIEDEEEEEDEDQEEEEEGEEKDEEEDEGENKEGRVRRQRSPRRAANAGV